MRSRCVDQSESDEAFCTCNWNRSEFDCKQLDLISAFGPRPPDDARTSLSASRRLDRARNQFGDNERGIPIAEPWA